MVRHRSGLWVDPDQTSLLAMVDGLVLVDFDALVELDRCRLALELRLPEVLRVVDFRAVPDEPRFAVVRLRVAGFVERFVVRPRLTCRLPPFCMLRMRMTASLPRSLRASYVEPAWIMAIWSAA
ncbi:MAG TPA: hypothetical protein VIL34_13990 [Actinopolymorphaceae bacterium]